MDVKEAIFLDTLLKRLQQEPRYPSVGVARITYASLIANEYVDEILDSGGKYLVISNKGVELLDKGGFCKMIPRKKRRRHYRQQRIVLIKDKLKSARCKLVWRGVYIAIIVAGALAAVLMLFK